MLFFVWKYSLLVPDQWTYWNFIYGSAIRMLFAKNRMWNNGIIMEPLNYKIAPKTFRCFVEDSHGCFQDMSHADKFLEILHKQNLAIKCTVEFEDQNIH